MTARSQARATINGETRVTGLIGDPIGHSRSPAILNAAFAATALNWVYLAFPVPAGAGAAALQAVRTLGLAGVTVTMPHKSDAAAACDELTPVAAALGAVNVVTASAPNHPLGSHQLDVRLLGSSTDGEGFLRSVRDEGFEPGGRRALVLGAGGAARAIVLALGAAGAEVTVAARRRDAAASAAALAPDGAAATLADVDPGVADLVVNATPLGMRGELGPVDAERLNPQQLVVDTVYHPMETPFLAAVRARGIPSINGLGMLVYQAALAF